LAWVVLAGGNQGSMPNSLGERVERNPGGKRRGKGQRRQVKKLFLHPEPKQGGRGEERKGREKAETPNKFYEESVSFRGERGTEGSKEKNITTRACLQDQRPKKQQETNVSWGGKRNPLRPQGARKEGQKKQREKAGRSLPKKGGGTQRKKGGGGQRLILPAKKCRRFGNLKGKNTKEGSLVQNTAEKTTKWQRESRQSKIWRHRT